MDLIIKDTKADFNEYFDICNASDETKEKFETKDLQELMILQSIRQFEKL